MATGEPVNPQRDHDDFDRLPSVPVPQLQGVLPAPEDTGLAFVDATSLVVCHNRRIHNHKVFKAVARRGKTSMGWFYGFKLHLVVNDRGELLAFRITPGNVDDREPVPELTQGLTGKLIGDRGYISHKSVRIGTTNSCP